MRKQEGKVSFGILKTKAIENVKPKRSVVPQRSTRLLDRLSKCTQPQNSAYHPNSYESFHPGLLKTISYKAGLIWLTNTPRRVK